MHHLPSLVRFAHVMLIIGGTAPHEFTSVPFPVKALKLLVHDLRSGGDSATIPKVDLDVDSDDGVRAFSVPLPTLH